MFLTSRLALHSATNSEGVGRTVGFFFFCTNVERDGWMSVAVRLKRLLVAAADRQRRCDTERSLGLSAAHSLAMTIIATSKAEQAGRSLTLVKSEPD